VTIYKGDGVVTGFGLEARPSEEITLVRGRVKATFGGPKGPDPPSSASSKGLPKPLPKKAGKEASDSRGGELAGKVKS
jgi:hypothetical protein